MRIVILEDNSDRRETMSAVLTDLIPGAKVEFFVAAGPMIEHKDKRCTEADCGSRQSQTLPP